MTTNYIDYKISNRVSSEFRRVVTGKTDITPLASGREIRNAAWAYKKMTYTASFAMLTPEAQEEVTSAFYVANAQLYLFRFRDYGDYIATQSPLTVPANEVGFRSPIQLTKRYLFGPAFADRVIQAVVTCSVFRGLSTPVPGTFDPNMGLFTPTDPWLAGGNYSWTGTFDVWVRFNSDELDITMKTLDIATTDIELSEQLAYDSTVHGS